MPLEWIQLIRDVGFPMALVIASGLGFWRVIVWLGSNVFKPVTAKHIEFIDTASKCQQDIVRNQQSIMTAQVETTERCGKMDSHLNRIAEAQVKMSHSLAATASAQAKLATDIGKVVESQDRTEQHMAELTRMKVEEGRERAADAKEAKEQRGHFGQGR